jgi:peptidyl-prolyl cis-trans isomerase A (cyclophilin A)
VIRPLTALSCLSMAAAGCSGTAPVNQPAAAENKVSAQNEGATAAAQEPLPDSVRVRIETEAGAIVVALDAKRAPVTTANFVRYAQEGRFDGTEFYRAARTRGTEGRGFIQGGIRRDYKRMLPPIAHEPSSATGLKHEAGAISMARTDPGKAMGEFFITTSAMPSMDGGPGDPGYAVFGRVVEGMDVVRRILAGATVAEAGRGAMRGQMLEQPVRIVRARRVE